jgi:hypothetical protein
MAKESEAAVLGLNGREVRVTHPDKPYFSQARLSKLDLVRYFLSVAPGGWLGFGIARSYSSALWTARRASRSIRSARRRGGRTG